VKTKVSSSGMREVLTHALGASSSAHSSLSGR
jgi:hypothetical protein